MSRYPAAAYRPVHFTRVSAQFRLIDMQGSTPEATPQKPCLCQVRPLSGLVFKATGKTNAKGQSEYVCRICGRTEWR